MSLEQEFDNWLASEFPGIVEGWVEDPDSERDLAWVSYQAGYAARKKEVDDRENAMAADALENSLKPTRSTPRTPINEVDY